MLFVPAGAARAGYEISTLILIFMVAFLCAYLAVYAATSHRRWGTKIAVACVAAFALYAMVGLASLANGWPWMMPEYGTTVWALWQGAFMGFAIASLTRPIYLIGR